MPRVTSNEGKPYAEIGTLIRNLRLRHGLSQFDLAHTAGINNSYLSRIENGERRPSPKILKKFSEILKYPYDKLVVTSGILSEDFVRSTPPVQTAAYNPQFGQAQADPTTVALQQLIQTIQGAGAQAAPAGVDPAQRRAVPVFDTVPAGLLKEANIVDAHDDVAKLVLGEEELAYDPRAFALIVSGDSMIEAGILDGDVIVVSPGTSVKNGDIAVVQVNQRSTTVKQVYFEEHQIILQPANHRFKPELVGYPDEAEVLGKVVLVRRKLY